MPIDAAPAQQRFWDSPGRGPGRGARTGHSALQIDRSRRYLRRILVGLSEASKLQSRWDRVNARDVPNGAEQPSPIPLTLLPPDDDSGRTSPTAASCQLASNGAWVDDAKGPGCTGAGAAPIGTPARLQSALPTCCPAVERSTAACISGSGGETIRIALTKDYAGGEAWERLRCWPSERDNDETCESRCCAFGTL